MSIRGWGFPLRFAITLPSSNVVANKVNSKASSPSTPPTSHLTTYYTILYSTCILRVPLSLLSLPQRLPTSPFFTQNGEALPSKHQRPNGPTHVSTLIVLLNLCIILIDISRCRCQQHWWLSKNRLAIDRRCNLLQQLPWASVRFLQPGRWQQRQLQLLLDSGSIGCQWSWCLLHARRELARGIEHYRGHQRFYSSD